jgi:hypothetical protein
MFDPKLMCGSLILGLALACGGGGGGSAPAPTLATGVLVDSPVAGLPYASGSQSGLTGPGGQFTYPAGAAVTFSLGGLTLPAVTGAAVLTPLSIFGAETYNDARAVNLARLLQTLDEDGNAANGITIPGTALQAAAGLSLTRWDAVDFDTQVDPLMQAVGKSLVTASAAMTHLMGQSIVGTWCIDDPVPTRVEFFTFLPEGTVLYGVHAPTHPDEPITGIQRADYTWDPATGAMAISHLDVNTAGTWGLLEPATGLASVEWHVTGTATGEATMTRVNHGSQTFAVKRLTSAAGPLAGTWLFRPVGHDLTLFSMVSLPGGYYAAIVLGQADLEGGPGLDFGTYTFDVPTGTFTATPIADTSGGWGITVDDHTPNTDILVVTGSTLTNDQTPPETILRLEP